MDYNDLPRDLKGYGECPPTFLWPGDKRIAVQFVINYEEGGESCLLNKDSQSEHLLSEIVGASPYQGQRHMNMESLYEYGSRAGFWRLHRLFKEFDIPCTVFAVGSALAQNPEAGHAMIDAGWEVASHGLRWIDYQNISYDVEDSHIRETIKIHEKILGERPKGIYQGKPNCQTRAIIVNEGGFTYDSDSYADDLPYWNYDHDKPHLIIPYTLDNNDMRFFQGLEGDRFFEYLRDAYEGLTLDPTAKMMSIGLHCRIIGRPGRIMALRKFIEFLKGKNNVWICRRIDIANHWIKNYPPQNII